MKRAGMLLAPGGQRGNCCTAGVMPCCTLRQRDDWLDSIPMPLSVRHALAGSSDASAPSAHPVLECLLSAPAALPGVQWVAHIEPGTESDMLRMACRVRADLISDGDRMMSVSGQLSQQVLAELGVLRTARAAVVCVAFELRLLS